MSAVPFLQQTYTDPNAAWARVQAGAQNFANANANFPSTSASRAGALGVRVADAGRQFATGLTSRTAAGLGGVGAGLVTAMSGGGIGETLGSGSGAAIGTAVAGKFMPQILAKGGPIGALAGGALALAAPTIGSMLGGGIGKGIDNSSYARAAGQGADARAQSLLNPNSLGNLVDSNMAKILKEGYANSELVKKYGLDNVMINEAGMNRVAIPLMREQAAIGARMMPLNVAARNSVNTVAGMNQGMNTSIAGINALAQQVAANNPYNFQV